MPPRRQTVPPLYARPSTRIHCRDLAAPCRQASMTSKRKIPRRPTLCPLQPAAAPKMTPSGGRAACSAAVVRSGRPGSWVSPGAARERSRRLHRRCLLEGNDAQGAAIARQDRSRLGFHRQYHHPFLAVDSSQRARSGQDVGSSDPAQLASGRPPPAKKTAASAIVPRGAALGVLVLRG